MVVGVIGGSGLESGIFLERAVEKELVTEFGSPSSTLTVGFHGDMQIVFLSRHGADHQITPTHVNYRANITALKKLGL